VGFKDIGLVSDVFRRYGHDPVLKVAIAHTRYSTHGETYRPENVQPFVGFIEGRMIALVHNGNLTNYLEGAWTVLMIDGDRLVAFRDPYGFRPLWMGREGEDVWFASEDSALRSADIEGRGVRGE